MPMHEARFPSPTPMNSFDLSSAPLSSVVLYPGSSGPEIEQGCAWMPWVMPPNNCSG